MGGRRRVPIRWIHISDYYDVPLCGWVRVPGRYLYFEVDNPFARTVRHRLYEVVPHALAIEHLRRVRDFRRIVGWHSERLPGGGERRWFSSETHPNWRSFYDLPKPVDPVESGARLIGVTNLHKTALVDRDWWRSLKRDVRSFIEPGKAAA